MICSQAAVGSPPVDTPLFSGEQGEKVRLLHKVIIIILQAIYIMYFFLVFKCHEVQYMNTFMFCDICHIFYMYNNYNNNNNNLLSYKAQNLQVCFYALYIKHNT